MFFRRGNKPPSGEEELSYEENFCHTYACAIQECLRRKNYDEGKCRKQIERWKQCLREAKAEKSRKHESALHGD